MKSATALLLRIALCLSSMSAPVLANDSTFGGAGADLTPLEETRVRMVSEDIQIEYRGRWHVAARYVFENLTEHDVRVQVGFPEYRCQDEHQDCANVPFQDLRTEVDGTEIAHRRGTLSKEHVWTPYLGVVWLYDVTFPAGREVRILHTYSVASGGNVEQSRFTSYVTRTGAMWAGTIGHARFTFRLPATAHTVIVPKGIDLRSLQLLDPDGPAPRVEVVCEQSNWKPAGDLWILFNDSTHLALERLGSEALERGGLRAEDLCPPWSERDSATPAQRQMCVNDQYAVAGYPFKKKSLRDYYYGAPFPWRKEPIPWDENERWYVRGLRALPGLPAWQDRAVQPEEAPSTPGVPASTEAQPQPGAAVSAGPPKRPGAAPQSPPPVEPRSRGCGCQLPVGQPTPYWPLAILSLFAWLRRTTRTLREASTSARDFAPCRHDTSSFAMRSGKA